MDDHSDGQTVEHLVGADRRRHPRWMRRAFGLSTRRLRFLGLVLPGGRRLRRCSSSNLAPSARAISRKRAAARHWKGHAAAPAFGTAGSAPPARSRVRPGGWQPGAGQRCRDALAQARKPAVLALDGASLEGSAAAVSSRSWGSSGAGSSLKVVSGPGRSPGTPGSAAPPFSCSRPRAASGAVASASSRSAAAALGLRAACGWSKPKPRKPISLRSGPKMGIPAKVPGTCVCAIDGPAHRSSAEASRACEQGRNVACVLDHGGSKFGPGPTRDGARCGPTTSASAPETWTKRVSASAFPDEVTAPDGLGFHTVVGVLAVLAARPLSRPPSPRDAGALPTWDAADDRGDEHLLSGRQRNEATGTGERRCEAGRVEPKALQARALPRCEPRGQRFGDGPEQAGSGSTRPSFRETVAQGRGGGRCPDDALHGRVPGPEWRHRAPRKAQSRDRRRAQPSARLELVPSSHGRREILCVRKSRGLNGL